MEQSPLTGVRQHNTDLGCVAPRHIAHCQHRYDTPAELVLWGYVPRVERCPPMTKVISPPRKSSRIASHLARNQKLHFVMSSDYSTFGS